MAGGVGRTVALVALVALLSMAMAEDTVTSRLMQGQETGRGRAGGSDATLELDRPWDEGREVEKKERLQDVLKAIKEAEAADREAAKQEKAFGGKKLADANSATAQAAKFMSKAERLLRSEEALKQEERNVEAKLVSLKDSGVMGGHWRSHGTEFADEWRIYPKRPLERLKEVARRRAMLKSSKGKKGKGKNGKGKVVAVNDDVSDLDKDGKLQSRASDQFNDLPQGKPYGDNQWTDSKPKVRWSYYRKNTIKAGFDLSNCFLAAQKDKSQVVVKILEKQETHIIKTANGISPSLISTVMKGLTAVQQVVPARCHGSTFPMKAAMVSCRSQVFQERQQQALVCSRGYMRHAEARRDPASVLPLTTRLQHGPACRLWSRRLRMDALGLLCQRKSGIQGDPASDVFVDH
eukprot:749592-Hanusia_phi.AAC.3